MAAPHRARLAPSGLSSRLHRRLANLPRAGLTDEARQALNDEYAAAGRRLGELEVRLATLSRSLRGQRAARGVEWEGVQAALLGRLRDGDDAGRFWIQRQALRQVRVGRDLLPQSAAGEAAGMLVLGGIDYERFSEPSPDAGPDGEDGILYALEAQNLNLEGTELVTLSARDTGKGRVDTSEGVYGLVRAFQIAGSRHVLMTQWALNDPAARAFMVDFYAKWLEPDAFEHPAEALRATQLEWIDSGDPVRADPRRWAPYALIERG